jgi:hypothetical protein
MSATFVIYLVVYGVALTVVGLISATKERNRRRVQREARGVGAGKSGGE